jgi:hypothetical protein
MHNVGDNLRLDLAELFFQPLDDLIDFVTQLRVGTPVVHAPDRPTTAPARGVGH